VLHVYTLWVRGKVEAGGNAPRSSLEVVVMQQVFVRCRRVIRTDSRAVASEESRMERESASG